MPRPRTNFNPNQRDKDQIKKKARRKDLKPPAQIANLWFEAVGQDKLGRSSKRICLNQQGLDKLVEMKSKDLSLATMAHVLMLSRNQLAVMIERRNEDGEEGPEMKAYHLGKGLLEDKLSRLIQKQAEKGIIPAIYFTKARLDWHDNKPAVAVEGEKHVHIHLPDSMSRKEFFDSLNIAHELQHQGMPKALEVPVAETAPVTSKEAGWPPEPVKGAGNADQ